jgi:hypothetical protein
MIELLNSVLSDLEKESIATFLANKTMSEAVRKVLLAEVYYNGVLAPDAPAAPTRNFALTQVISSLSGGLPITNEELGQSLRAKGEGVYAVEAGWQRLEKLVPAVPAKAKAPAQRAK